MVCLRVLPFSVLPSFLPGVSWDWVISCFLKFNMVLGTHVLLTVTEPDFLEKIYLPQKWAKSGFFEFIGKMSNYFFLNLVYDESLCYLLYSCINPIFGNQIIWESFDLGQWNCKVFKSTLSRIEWWKSLIFSMLIQVYENLKLIEKYWYECSQKWMWIFWSQDSKIGCISRWN